MEQSQAKKCAHSLCTCTVTGDDNYCCEQCKISSYGDELKCGCGCPHCCPEGDTQS